MTCMKTLSISNTRWERTNSYHRPWRIRGKTGLQSFKQTQAFPPTKYALFFLRWKKKISAWVRWWTHRTSIGLFCPHKMNWYWWKPNAQLTSWYLWWSLAMEYLHSSSHIASDLTQRSTSNGGGSVALDWKGNCWKTLSQATGLHHATQAGEPSHG